MYIFGADTFCDGCGEQICKRLVAAGKAPANVADQSSYDSDDFPKRCGDDDDHGASDSPCHCGSGPKCINAEKLNDGGEPLAKLLGTDLTPAGEQYVIEYIDQEESETNLVTVFWARKFAPHYDSIREAAEKFWGKNWSK